MTLSKMSIRHLHMWIIMATSSMAVLLACLAFIACDAMSFRQQWVNNQSSMVAAVGNALSAAIDANDQKTAIESLSALRSEPDVMAACIYDRHGMVFATYQRNPAARPAVFPAVRPDSEDFTAGELRLFRSIKHGNDLVGSIFVASDWNELPKRLARYAGIIGLILLLTFTIALAQSKGLQQVILDPIQHLAHVARAVAHNRNYSLLTDKNYAGELGELIDGFNEMLGQIQLRDAALQAARECLEQRVAERTKELAESFSLLNATLNSTNDGILVVDHAGKKVIQNQRTVELWKIPAAVAANADDSLQIAHVTNMVRDPVKFIEHIKYLNAELEAVDRDEVELKDGTILERMTSPVLGKDGRNYGRIWTFRDITKNRMAEAALRESEANYYSLVDQMPAGVFRKDKDGRYVFVNSWYCQLKGLKAEDLLGRNPVEAANLTPAPGTRIAGSINNREIAGRGVNHHLQIMQTGKPVEVEEVYHHTDGEAQYLHVIKSPVTDSDGTIIGSQGMLFDVTERRHTEDELARERDLLRTLMNNSPDSIFFKDLNSRYVKLSRSEAANLLKVAVARHQATQPAENPAGLPVHLSCLEKFQDYVVGKSDADFYGRESAAEFVENERTIMRTGVSEVGKVEEAQCANGKSIWHITSKVPWRNEAGEIIGTFGTARDITDLKEAEKQIQEAHKQLLETSRQAGMAEVATNVLHNVGNVLNSINVSSTVVVDTIKNSRLNNLGRVAGMIHDHKADLGAFFQEDPKGRQLPDYLQSLAGHLVEEQAGLLKEVELTRKHIEHIKDIVSMQQSYAKVSGVTERVKVIDLIEDAIRMNTGALLRHEVQLAREYSEAVPEITVERHKVLQVLVNLIRNAKYACDESGREDKLLTVRLQLCDGRVRIGVIDNGVGIRPENMNRIFNHGFTTRKHGHGFGLHSGALVAREMGGSLTAHSDGPGTGAGFFLELPLQPPQKS